MSSNLTYLTTPTKNMQSKKVESHRLLQFELSTRIIISEGDYGNGKHERKTRLKEIDSI